MTFRAENFVKEPAVLLTEAIKNLRLDGLLTLIAITRETLGGLINSTRYPEQMRENVKKFEKKRSSDASTQIRDLRHILIQYFPQKNRFGTGKDKTIEKEEDARRYTGACPY